MLLNDTLTIEQFSHCTNMTDRSYELFFHPFNEVSFLTGANVLDVAKIGIDGALLNLNLTQITDAYRRIHEEVVVQQAIEADGIRPDGSFGANSSDYGFHNLILLFQVSMVAFSTMVITVSGIDFIIYFVRLFHL
jgi:hypothetical protein